LDSGDFSYTMAFDNLFLYLLVSIGFVGTTFFLLFLLGAYASLASKFMGIFLSLVVSYFFIGLGAESFQTSVTGSLFWTIYGILFALSELERGNSK